MLLVFWSRQANALFSERALSGGVVPFCGACLPALRARRPEGGQEYSSRGRQAGKEGNGEEGKGGKLGTNKVAPMDFFWRRERERVRTKAVVVVVVVCVCGEAFRAH